MESSISQDHPFSRNGIPLHLESMKCAASAAERNILLVHGVTYSSHEFDIAYRGYSLVRFLAENGYTVWRLDIAGFGLSGAVEDGFMPDSAYAAEDICCAAEKILELTGAEKIDLLGWSWGTVTCSLFAAKHAEMINNLVLYAPIAAGIGAEEVAEAFHKNTREHAEADFQKDAEGRIDFSIAEPEVVGMFCEGCMKYDGARSPNGGRRDICVAQTERLIDFAAIKNRTLVICGTKDSYLNLDVIKEGFEKLPENSKLLVIDGAAHCAYIEKPYYRQLQQSLLSFLRSSP